MKWELESLEDRTVLSTMEWIGASGGIWNVATNWVNQTDAADHHVPTASDDALIDTAGVVVNHSTGTDAANSVYVQQGTLNLTGGSLDIATTLQVDGTFNLGAGTLLNADLTSGSTINVTASGGVLDSVRIDGTFQSTNFNRSTTVRNGLTLNGTANLGNPSNTAYGALIFLGTQTLDGTGEVVFGQGTNNSITSTSPGSGDTGTLTIGSGITVHGDQGQVGNSTYPLINQGTIAAEVTGHTINVYGGPLTNQGTLKADGGTLSVHFGTGGTSTGTLAAVNGGILSTADTWALAGTTTAGAGATVNLGGTVQLDTGYSLDTAAGTLNLTGTLDLAGGTAHTLTLDAASGSLNLRNGTILGGTVSGSDGAQLVAAFGISYLRQGVTLDADLDMTTSTLNRVYVYDGLTLNGTIALGSADGAALRPTVLLRRSDARRHR